MLPEPEIVTRKGKPVSVIIPIKDYEELLERAEDTDDVARLKRARRKPLHYRPLEDYLAERNGKSVSQLSFFWKELVNQVAADFQSQRRPAMQHRIAVRHGISKSWNPVF